MNNDKMIARLHEVQTFLTWFKEVKESDPARLSLADITKSRDYERELPYLAVQVKS